mgnify:CR=1 FL=1
MAEPEGLGDDTPQGLGETPDAAQDGADQEFEFDGREVEDSYPLVEEGRHHAIVIDFQKDTSEAGNDMYAWEFQIVSGPDKGETIRDWTSLLPQARWKVADYLEACGVEKARGSLAKFKKSDIVDTPVIVEVEHNERDGDTQDDVADLYAGTEDTKKAAKQYVDGDIPF